MDITNKKLAAQCLIEAAELLNESAGYNGLPEKVLKQRADKAKSDYEKEKAKNDEIDKTGEKIGARFFSYDNKNPGFIGRSNEYILKDDIDENNEKLKRTITDHKALKMFKQRFGNGKLFDTAKDIYMANSLGGDLYDKVKEAKNGTGSPLHKRINDRAKTKNESISLLLDEAIELLERED